MQNQKKINSNLILAIVLLGSILFYLFVLPSLQCKQEKDLNKVKEKFVNSSNVIRKLDQNMCSKQCCNHSQWPVPHDAKSGPIPKDKLKNYIGTNLTCNYGNGSGCLCVTKDDFNYLANRGGNSGNNMCK